MKQERVLPINNGYNFRDLGGYSTTDGHTTKWGRLIRSGSLNRLDQTDTALLTGIPVTVDIDLRSQHETVAAPDQVPATADYYGLPVFDVDVTNASRSDEEIAKDMQVPGNGYRHMLAVYEKMAQIPSAKRAYQQMFALLLKSQSGATLFHCTAGKDRTGFGAFLILTALGVPRQTIIDDYLLTNTVTADFRKKWLHQLQTSKQELGNVDAVIENRRDMAMVRPEYLGRAIATVNKVAGDANHYLTNYLGLSAGDLADLRHFYLD